MSDELIALASLAGQAIVTAAATDAWEPVRGSFAELLACGDAERAGLVGRRLDQARIQMLAGGGLRDRVRADLVNRWAGRFEDFLEERPDLADDLRAVIHDCQVSLGAGTTSSSGYSAAAGRDIQVAADAGSVAAAVIHGNVSLPGNYRAGAGSASAGSGLTLPGAGLSSGSAPGGEVRIVAIDNSVAIGQLIYQLPAVPGHPVSLAPRAMMLAGRERMLADLDARLAGSDGESPRVVVLCGLGGMGKTSVAVEYAHRHLAATGLVWQFPADDSVVLAAEFARLAAQLGASAGLLDPRDPVASVHQVLAASPRRWLLIFDNVPDQDAVRPFLPPAGNGGVLITTQSTQWPPDWATDVPVLDLDAAAGFLTARTGDGDWQAATALAAELGQLPLALEQAGAYVYASGGTLGGYLSAFRRRHADMLVRGSPTGYRKTVGTTWELAFSQIERAGQPVGGLLRLLAFLAPEPVPLRLLLTPRPGIAGQFGSDVAGALAPLLDDQMAVADAVISLRRYSLIVPARDGLVSIHRLVQAVVADHVPGSAARQWRQAAAALIEAAVPTETGVSETWPACAMLLPHGRACLASDSDALARLADYLGQSGNHAAARDMYQELAAGRARVLGSRHPRCLSTRLSQAGWTGEAGDPAGARRLLAELTPDYERVLGADHPDTLDARGNLAIWTGEDGNPAAARDLFAALLPDLRRIKGPEDSDTLESQLELARWTGLAGDAAAARNLYAEVLPVVTRVRGAEHPETLAARANLAVWTGETGDASAARDMLADLLPVSERIYGPRHPAALTDRANLARWTGQAGDAARARDEFAALHAIRSEAEGPTHPDVLGDLMYLAHWTGEAGDPGRAREIMADLLPVTEDILGREHPRTLVMRHELALWTGNAGDAAAARDQFSELLALRVEALGPDHPRTMETRRELAIWSEKASSPKKSE